MSGNIKTLMEKDDTGYKDLNEGILAAYNCQDFAQLSEADQKEEIDYILSVIRNRNIYLDVYYYSHEDIIKEIIACKEKVLPEFDGDTLDKRPTLGNLLLKYIFPNFHLVDCKGVKDNSLYARFIDDHKLWRTIEYCLKFKPKIKTPVASRSLAMGLEMIGGNIPTSYLPMKVKMFLDYYMPNGGNYFDFMNWKVKWILLLVVLLILTLNNIQMKKVSVILSIQHLNLG